MQRSIKISTAAASALLLFAGCGGGDSTPASSPGASPADTDTVTVQCPADAATCITVWVDETRQGPVADAAQTYMAANSGVGFEIVQKNYDDIRADFIQQVPTGQGPDITVGANDWTGELVQAGVVAPVTLQNTSDYEEVAINAFTFDGQLYAVPYAIENIALIRNTDLAPDAPATWDDAIAAAEAAGTEHKVLIQTGDQGDPYTYYPLQTSFGAPVFESDGQGGYSTTVGMGGEPGHNYAAWLQQQGSAGNLSTSVTYDIAVAAFAAKEAPFIIGGPWMISSFEGINLSIDPIPTTGDQTAAPFVGVQGFFVSAQTDNAIAANDFLASAIGTEDVQVELAKAGARPPALTAAQAQAVSADTTGTMEGFMKVGADGAPMPNIPQMASVWTPWGVVQAQIIGGQASDPASAWDQMITNVTGAIS